jgi:uracil-DNA glycosylase family protein
MPSASESHPKPSPDQVVPLLEPNPAMTLLEKGASLGEIAEAAKGCRACPLYAGATQTVFGQQAGRVPKRATTVLVGEQPGDHEDREGSPFVGPAGRVLWQAVDQAGLRAEDVYATNVVKHFKWTAGNGKRLHAKPNRREVDACFPWLQAEIELLAPTVIVGLGATACQSILGPKIRITKDRGSTAEWSGYPVVVTYHPSAILRARDEESRSSMMTDLVEDLRTARSLLA